LKIAFAITVAKAISAQKHLSGHIDHPPRALITFRMDIEKTGTTLDQNSTARLELLS
jgi:hypothetical protein